MNDYEKLQTALKADYRQQQAVITSFFQEHMGLVEAVKGNYRLTKEERQSAYSDAILDTIEAIREGKFRGDSTVKTFLTRIFNFKCVDLIHKNETNKRQVHRTEWIDDMFHLSDNAKSVVNDLIDKEKVAELLEKLDKIGEKCKQLLLAVGKGYSTDEITEKLGYGSTKSLKSMKYKCLQKLLKH